MEEEDSGSSGDEEVQQSWESIEIEKLQSQIQNLFQEDLKKFQAAVKATKEEPQKQKEEENIDPLEQDLPLLLVDVTKTTEKLKMNPKDVRFQLVFLLTV